VKSLVKKRALVALNAKIAKDTPDKAIFLAVKRTLRERWKQAVFE